MQKFKILVVVPIKVHGYWQGAAFLPPSQVFLGAFNAYCNSPVTDGPNLRLQKGHQYQSLAILDFGCRNVAAPAGSLTFSSMLLTIEACELL
jgi:hypothetical protein